MFFKSFMKNYIYIFLVIVILGLTIFIGISLVLIFLKNNIISMPVLNKDIILLPNPEFKSNGSVEEALKQRRSVRNYANDAITFKELSQVLWAAQGVTDEKLGYRTAPSAGALYPLELYVVAGNVADLSSGVYKYIPDSHSIKKVQEGDLREQVAHAALEQDWVKDGAALLVFTGIFERTAAKYGQRGIQYVYIEVGHAAQNVYLQCESLGLNTGAVGAFSDSEIKTLLQLPDNEDPLYIMPVGR
jgi:SagB-type dehydrogenase family enzyme